MLQSYLIDVLPCKSVDVSIEVVGYKYIRALEEKRRIGTIQLNNLWKQSRNALDRYNKWQSVVEGYLDKSEMVCVPPVKVHSPC